MTSKGIGFNRIIRGPWLDATAALCQETDDLEEMRRRLHLTLENDIKGAESRDRTIDILLRTWVKSRGTAPELQAEAVRLFADVETSSDRIWLHWGLLLISYPVVRDGVAAIGKASRFGEPITRAKIDSWLASGRGEIASLYLVSGRMISLLREWDVLVKGTANQTYDVAHSFISTNHPEIETWLLACALNANSAQAVLKEDLLDLPELFPFKFATGTRALRESPWFEVNRQGISWDVVSLNMTPSRIAIAAK